MEEQVITFWCRRETAKRTFQHFPLDMHNNPPGPPPRITKVIITFVLKSRRMRWAGHVARMRERRGAYRVLVGKPEGKRETQAQMEG